MKIPNNHLNPMSTLVLFASMVRRVSVLLCIVAVVATTPARERISINEDWRFIKGDPTNITESLLYDVRRAEALRRMGNEADGNAGMNEFENQTNQPAAVIKRWILPTANAFIKDPSRRFARPEGKLPGDGVAYVQHGFDDSSWRQLDLPHDWAIEGPFSRSGNASMGRLPNAAIAWYRKTLNFPAADAGKSIFLDVDGAMSYATVWLNGQLVGGWPFGYASWRVNLTPYVKPGEPNVLAIRLDNPPNSSRWYPGGGIYRNVWLVKTAPVHVAQWGTYMTTPEVSPDRGTVNLKVTIDNDSSERANVSVSTEIFALDENGNKARRAVATLSQVNLEIPPGTNAVAQSTGAVTRPKLWGPPPTQQPNRYVAVTTVVQDGRTLDSYETRFGFRTVEFDPDRGLIVNGERIQIKGVNQHHDLGALGAAYNDRAALRQLEMLREMGCNAIRMSHNPPARELLELTDRMGFLVVDETFDVWQRRKTPFDFHLIFADWSEPDLRAHVRRDRNHPSVILWSIGNEVGEQYTGADGAAVAKRLHDIVREEDPTRLTTTAMNWAKPDMPLPEVVDVISLNYQGEGIRDTPAHAGLNGIRTPPQYPAFHEKFPTKPIISSETAAAVSTRGTYLFPVFDGISAPVKDGLGGDSRARYVSAYELHAADFGSSADKVFAAQDRHPYVAGEFVWSGWDYLGEPTPYGASRSSYFGIIDLAGFKKDRFYLYQSRWRPELRLAHILPHWTWPERVGQVTPVHVFTSGDEAELFVNGKSQGRKTKQSYEYRIRWDNVVYEPGTVRVVARKNGRRWAADEVQTAGEPARLDMTADRSEIRADGKDLSFVTVTVTDKRGVMVPRADHRIEFSLEGPGEIVATDNGDPTSFESFQSPSRKAFNGLCLVIVRARSAESGRITLSAKADGLTVGTTTLRAVRRGP